MGLNCPVCGAEVEASLQRKMTPFFSFKIASVSCAFCNSKFYWHRKMHNKIMYLGFVLKIGVLIMSISFLGLMHYQLSWLNYSTLMGFILTMIGVFGKKSILESIKLEPAE